MTEDTPKIIPPTVGRVVWYRPNGVGVEPAMAIHNDQPLAALITHVWDDRLVNVVVFDHDSQMHQCTSVYLQQPDGDQANGVPYVEWMPYQKGQAAKAEALEQQVGERRAFEPGDNGGPDHTNPAA